MRIIVLERIARPRPELKEILSAMRGHHFANAVVSFLFACTGPVALILTVGIAGGLKPAEIASWISIAFGLGGVITFVMSVLFRQPLAMAWTIPGTAIVGAALLKFPYAEIVGAYVVTGAAMLLLGLSGGFRKLMDLMPQPIVMAMVAGLFLKFGLLAIDGFDKAPIVAVAATAGFMLFSLLKPLGRVIPPVLAALVAGGIAIGVLGGFQPREGAAGLIANPIFFAPKFTEAALLDLVLPLVISVLVLQNAQGIAILRMSGHNPPPNTVTAVCGVGTVAFGLFGAVCTCLTGPANAILSSSGEPRFHYIGALIWAGFAVVFGLFAPGITSLALAVPDAFIYVIGGLAMLRVLQQSLTAAFGGRFTAGAVVCMVVTVTELIPEARFTLLGIGAPFWGLVFGIVTSLLLEPGDFRKPAKAEAQPAAPAPAAAEKPAEPEPPARPVPLVPAWVLEPELKAEPVAQEVAPAPAGPVPARAKPEAAPEPKAKPGADETTPATETAPAATSPEAAPQPEIKIDFVVMEMPLAADVSLIAEPPPTVPQAEVQTGPLAQEAAPALNSGPAVGSPPVAPETHADGTATPLPAAAAASAKSVPGEASTPASTAPKFADTKPAVAPAAAQDMAADQTNADTKPVTAATEGEVPASDKGRKKQRRPKSSA